MKYAYTILYVPDVSAALAFYEEAFGLERRFLTDAADYGELDTGATALAFAAEELARSNGVPFRPARADDTAPAVELAFVVDDVAAAQARAVDAGASAVTEPVQKPWGQTVAYVRDIHGVLIELCTAMGG